MQMLHTFRIVLKAVEPLCESAWLYTLLHAEKINENTITFQLVGAWLIPQFVHCMLDTKDFKASKSTVWSARSKASMSLKEFFRSLGNPTENCWANSSNKQMQETVPEVSVPAIACLLGSLLKSHINQPFFETDMNQRGLHTSVARELIHSYCDAESGSRHPWINLWKQLHSYSYTWYGSTDRLPSCGITSRQETKPTSS